MATEQIYLDDILIQVVRKKVKNINLRIGKDKKVTLSANSKISMNKLQDFVMSKRDWIIYNFRKIESYYLKKESIKEKEYLTGEKLMLWGNEYILMVIEASYNKVEIEENILYIYTTEKNSFKKKKSLVDKYILKLAEDSFEKSLRNMLEKVKGYGVSMPEMKIRKMKSRWGSCNRKQKIVTLNLELIKYDSRCLDYVSLHELVHFIEPSHNKVFYGYISIFMPDWKQVKKILKDNAAL